ncbi:MAG: hypothetical protein IPP34_20365 [Bacteroidetes bacterium]|nr:hypothetical protein [Bacteroidota bacterium]MBL0074021.1 hypothetical protein [Bacteroidota bacterium]
MSRNATFLPFSLQQLQTIPYSGGYRLATILSQNFSTKICYRKEQLD